MELARAHVCVWASEFADWPHKRPKLASEVDHVGGKIARKLVFFLGASIEEAVLAAARALDERGWPTTYNFTIDALERAHDSLTEREYDKEMRKPAHVKLLSFFTKAFGAQA